MKAIIVDDENYDGAFEEFLDSYKNDEINIDELVVFDDDGEMDNLDYFFDQISFENQNRLIELFIQKGVPSYLATGGLPLGITYLDSSNRLDYLRAVDFDHLTAEGYEEVESMIDDEWSENDMTIYAIAYFNGDVQFRFMDLEFPPDSLLDKIEEDEDEYDKFIKIFLNERDIYAKKINQDIADEKYNDFMEVLEEDE